MIGLCDGLGSSGGHCLLLTAALCGLEMHCLYWYLLLVHCGGPEMSVFLMCCKRGVQLVVGVCEMLLLFFVLTCGDFLWQHFGCLCCCLLPSIILKVVWGMSLSVLGVVLEG